MADTFDSRIEVLLREALTAEVASLPLTVTPDHVLERAASRKRQHVGWRALLGRFQINRFLPALAGGAAVLIVAVVVFGLFVNQPGIGEPATPSPTASQSTAAQQTSPSPSIKPTISGSMWPQSTLEEVQAAQKRADAGDHRYRWQVDPDLEAHLGQGGPYRAEILTRFLEEVLGWEEFGWTLGNGAYEGRVVFLRCAPGSTNPLYSTADPQGRGCAPTIDEFRYETVHINVAQLHRQGPTGIWVVTGWDMLEPFERIAPPSDEPHVGLGIFAPVAGRIVYGDRDGIKGVDPDAPRDPATRVKLASEPDIPVPLGWSSDGTRLLIIRGSRGEERLFVVDADGSQTQVTERAMSIRSATISPDGSRVVFAGGTGQVPGGAEGDCCARFALYAVDADGGPAEMLLESRLGILSNPTFAPDGTEIAYVDGRGDWGHSVWLVDVDGSNARQILANETTEGAGHARGLAWSPAGDRIALGLEGIIYTFATDGSGFTLTTRGDRPYWSPDGSQIVSGPWHPGTPENGAGG